MEQGVVTASLVAAVVLALLSRILAVVRRCPMTVFIMGGIFLWCPVRESIIRCIISLWGRRPVPGKGVETLKIAAAIAIGIVLVLALPGGFVPAVGVQVAKDTVKRCFAEMLQKTA